MHKDEQRELTELEAALRRLRPAAAGLDRDEMMFNAGGAAAGRHAGIHVSTTVLVAVLAALAGAGTAWIAAGPSSQHTVLVAAEKPVLRIVELSPTLPLAKESEPWTGAGDYLKLRDRVLAEGTDALPALGTGDGAPSGASLDDLYREMDIQSLRPYAYGRGTSSERSNRT
jgi:hypothetical protein